MTRHYSEADLLETYYTQPGESMPVMMHLASCVECAARYEKLEQKMRGIAACETERPPTFWSRQRLSIMKKIGDRSATTGAVRPARLAAAAVLTFVLGGAVVYKSVEPALKSPAVVIVTDSRAAAPAVDDDTAVRDPWQSEELQDFHSVVEWETWVDTNSNGGKS